MRPLSGEGNRTLLLYDASMQKLTDEVKTALGANIEVRFFQKNATDLCQPADSPTTRNLKTVRRRMWDSKKMEMISNVEWAD